MGALVGLTLAALLSGGATVDGVVARVDATAGARMRAALAGAGVAEKPGRLWLLGVKDERRLELWAARGKGRVLVKAWPMLAASGGPGPKLREGDLQVPEGVYAIESLNPNSNFHLSMRVGYPNAADRRRAAKEGRRRLGGDIYIHGNAVSIGCIAIGDGPIEELFWLAATAGPKAFTAVIVPTDLRRHPAPEVPGVTWAPELYRELRAELEKFPRR